MSIESLDDVKAIECEIKRLSGILAELREARAPKPRFVVCAACRVKFTGEIVIGPRHYDATMHKQMTSPDWGDPVEQGFIDQHGVFMTREEAWKVAEAVGQIRYRVGGDGEKLFSENLY